VDPESAIESLASIFPSESPATQAAPPAPSGEVAKPAHLSFRAGLHVAVVGDSFVNAGFSQELRRQFEPRGVKFTVDSWVSSTIANWASSDRLPAKLLEDPDIVIIALGANDVFSRDPEAIAPSIHAIVAAIGGRSCAWVLPPLWDGETGITWVLRHNVAPCTIFDSTSLHVERQPDGIHPTPKGGADWASAFISSSIRWSD
jgi:lysophospholipase L1-like esterase